MVPAPIATGEIDVASRTGPTFSFGGHPLSPRSAAAVSACETRGAVVRFSRVISIRSRTGASIS